MLRYLKLADFLYGAVDFLVSRWWICTSEFSPMTDTALVSKAVTRIGLKKLIPTVTVIDDSGDGSRELRVPIDAEAAIIALKVRMARMGRFFDKQADMIEEKGLVLEPDQLAKMITSARALGDATLAVYQASKPDDGAEGIDGKTVKIIKAAAEGVANARLSRLLSIGKKQMKQAEPVHEIEAKVPDPPVPVSNDH